MKYRVETINELGIILVDAYRVSVPESGVGPYIFFNKTSEVLLAIPSENVSCIRAYEE